jgi:hypothetical protein
MGAPVSEPVWSTTNKPNTDHDPYSSANGAYELAQLMEGATAGALIPENVRCGINS